MRIDEVQSKMWSKRDREMLVRTIRVRRCDIEGCDDKGWLYIMPGNVAYCSQHKHLAGEAS